MDFPVKKQKQRVLPAPDKSVSPSSQKGGMPPHASPLLKKHKQTPVVPSVPLLTTKKGAQGRCDRVSRFEGTLLRLEALDAVKIKRATDSSVAKFKMAVRFEGVLQPLCCVSPQLLCVYMGLSVCRLAGFVGASVCWFVGLIPNH